MRKWCRLTSAAVVKLNKIYQVENSTASNNKIYLKKYLDWY